MTKISQMDFARSLRVLCAVWILLSVAHMAGVSSYLMSSFGRIIGCLQAAIMQPGFLNSVKTVRDLSVSVWLQIRFIVVSFGIWARIGGNYIYALGSNLNEVSAQMWFFCSLISSAIILLYDGIVLVVRLSLKWGWSMISTPFIIFWSIMVETVEMIMTVVCSPWTLLKYLGAKYSDFVHQRNADLVELPEKPEPIRKGILEKLEQIEKNCWQERKT